MSVKMPGLRALAVAGLWVLLALVPGVARAQQCHVNDAWKMNFGTVTRAGGDSTSYIKYECQAPQSQQNQVYFFRLCLFLDAGAQHSINPRKMTDYQGHYLEYDLFSDPARQNLIGGVNDTGEPVYQLQMEVQTNQDHAVTGMGQAYIYGRVRPGQSVPAREFKETNVNGTLKYRYDTTAVPSTTDCSAGGAGGDKTAISGSEVVAKFEDSCGLTTTDLDFGTVDTLTEQVDATSKINVYCAASDNPWWLGLDKGLRKNRSMENGNYHISYELYKDDSRTQPWGDTDDNDRLAGYSHNGEKVEVTVFGRVPAPQNVPPGRYTDTVIVTLYH